MTAKLISTPSLDAQKQKQATAGFSALERLAGEIGRAGGDGQSLLSQSLAPRRKKPPVHLWNPDDCRDIDMRIALDGSWHYMGSPIGRPALVQLFASVLRRDDLRYVLVTPVEKVGIKVEDAPFLLVSMAQEARADGTKILRFTTNLGEEFIASAAYKLSFVAGEKHGIKIYLSLDNGLEARTTRSLTLDLLDLALQNQPYGLHSGDEFFALPAAFFADILED